MISKHINKLLVSTENKRDEPLYQPYHVKYKPTTLPNASQYLLVFTSKTDTVEREQTLKRP